VGILKESVISSVANGLSGQEIHLAILATVMFLISLGSIFIVGYLQWYVLRPYVTKARWWILIPFIAVLAGGGLFIIEFLSSGLLRFNRNVLNMTMLPITQAIGFCILKKRFVSEHPTLQSPLALATDIVNYWDVQKLQKILYTRISRIWKTDIRTSIGQLTYLIGVNHSGAMIYEPMNQASIDNVDRTPLPELASNPSFAASETEGLTDFAKFHVVFTPPGTFQIYSWRGIPLIWLGVAVYSGIIGISILCVW
jgi:hypothetical protein